jgi:hypothetical protein
MDYTKLPTKEIVTNTINALRENNISAEFFENREDLKKKLEELLPEGAEVMTMTSVTLDSLGITEIVNNSGKYNSLKSKLSTMDRATQGKEMNMMGTAPDFAIGSVHAVTEDGKVVIASNTGSQLPAYAYGSGRVIWVVGAQKITKDLDQAMDRVYSYTLPLESERAKKAYGVEGSNVSKLLIISKEVKPGRINILFLNENVGF